MTRITIALLALTLSSAGIVEAQQNTPRTAHAAAAAELIALLNLEEQMGVGLKSSFGALAVESPGATQMQEVMVGFMEEFLPWEIVEPEYVRVYQDAFTEAELRELIAFYSTPIGRRLVDATPQISRDAMALTQKLMQPHMPELQRRMMAAMGGRIPPQ